MVEWYRREYIIHAISHYLLVTPALRLDQQPTASLSELKLEQLCICLCGCVPVCLAATPLRTSNICREPPVCRLRMLVCPLSLVYVSHRD